MDLYAERRKEALELRSEIENNIKDVLSEKGYNVGDIARYSKEFRIEYDRILIDWTHPDNMSIEELLEALREAIKVLPKR